MEGGSKDKEILKYAEAVQSMAPHKIMVAVGYEPDLYVPEANPKKGPRGTTQDYKDMWKNFVRIFDDNQVDNVEWIMDYSFNIRDNPDLAIALWPDDEVVSWLFFNVFQFTKVADVDGKGDCPGGLDKIYRNFMDSFDSIPEWETIPWGLGAWGADGGNKWIKLDDRKHCIDGVTAALDSGNYPKLKASIYFNSLGSRIDNEMSPELLDNFNDLQNLDVYYEHDLVWGNKLAPWKGGLCGNICDDRCQWSALRWDVAGTAANRCNPDGFEYATEECETPWDGDCDGCAGSTCHWSWSWRDEAKEDSLDAICRCKLVQA